MGKKVYYKTWQEASAVCLANNVVSQADYRNRYHLIDTKLHNEPNWYYRDFPGWVDFLQRKKKRKIIYYKTWEEASKVCINNGIENMNQYYESRLRIDDRLPEFPRTTYRLSWPGDKIFFGENYKKGD